MNEREIELTLARVLTEMPDNGVAVWWQKPDNTHGSESIEPGQRVFAVMRYLTNQHLYKRVWWRSGPVTVGYIIDNAQPALIGHVHMRSSCSAWEEGDTVNVAALTCPRCIARYAVIEAKRAVAARLEAAIEELS